MIARDLLVRIDAIFDPWASLEERELAEKLIAFESQIPRDRLTECEREGRFPESELRAFADAGLMTELVPSSANGKLDWARAMRLATYGASYDLDFTLCLGGAVLGGAAVLVAGNSDQQTQYFAPLLEGEVGGLALSEWNHGSDLLANECVAARDGDHFVINGVKGPINNGSLGAHLVVLARTPSGFDASEQTLFLIKRETPGLSGERVFPSMGYRNMDLARVTLNNVRVPISAVLGKPGDGFLHVRRTLEISRSGVAAMACGAMASAASHATSHALERHLYQAPIAMLPAVRTLVARCVARLVLGATMVRTSSRAVSRWAGSARAWSCATKWLVPVLLERNIHDAGTVLGARSLMEDLPFARLRRSTPLLAIFDGSSQLQLDELFRHVAMWEESKVSRDEARTQLFMTLAEPFDPHRTDDAGVLDALSPLLGSPPYRGIAQALVPLARDARKTVHLRAPVSEVAAWLYAVNALDHGHARFPDAVRALALHEADAALVEPCARLGISTNDLLTHAPRVAEIATNTFDWIAEQS